MLEGNIILCGKLKNLFGKLRNNNWCKTVSRTEHVDKTPALPTGNWSKVSGTLGLVLNIDIGQSFGSSYTLF